MSNTYTPQRTALRSAKELAELYGNITYDEDVIRGKFDTATKAQYDASRKEYAATENQYYNQLSGAQTTALDTIRRANAAAVATGASRGMQAANELSSVLGLQQESVKTSTDLANQRNLLVDKEQAAYAQNAMDALKYSNETKQALGTLGVSQNANDTQYDVGMMNYYAALDAAEKNLQGVKETAEANRHAADQARAASEFGATQGYNGTVYAANRGLDSTKATTSSNERIAAGNNAATVAAAKATADGYAKANANTGGNMTYADYANWVNANPDLAYNAGYITKDQYKAILAAKPKAPEVVTNAPGAANPLYPGSSYIVPSNQILPGETFDDYVARTGNPQHISRSDFAKGQAGGQSGKYY